MTTEALSAIGRYNPTWFIVWTVVISLSVTGAFLMLGPKHIAYRIFVVLIGALKIASNSILGESDAAMTAHLFTAFTFGLLALTVTGLLLIWWFIKTRKYIFIILAGLHIVMSFTFLALILTFDFLAYIQIIVLILSLCQLLYCLLYGRLILERGGRILGNGNRGT